MSGLIDKEVSHKDEFVQELITLYRAAIGVIVVRTKETYRTVEAIRESAIMKNQEFKYWECVNGWRAFSPADGQGDDVMLDMCFTATADDNINLGPELKMLESSTDNERFPESCVYALLYYPKMFDNMHVGQLLKEYSQRLSATYKTVIIVAPESVTIPSELSGDISILDFKPPSHKELKVMYEELLYYSLPRDSEKAKVIRERVVSFAPEDVDTIISSASGMTQQEFSTAISCATVSNSTNEDFCAEDYNDAVLKAKTEVVKRSEVLELMPADDMTNVGGLENLKEWIAKRRDCFTEDAQEFGVDTPKGIALVGPSGTGKSLAAKAIASELNNIPLIKFDVSRVFKSLVGESESLVRTTLKEIDAMAPCVALIDEADKAFQTGGSNDSGVGTRVLGSLLTWMQETTAPVFVVVTANRTDNMPSEFLRKGRLDEVFGVTLPSPLERRDIIDIHLRKRGKSTEGMDDIDAAVDASEGYVPAEIEAAVKEAILEAYTQDKAAITGSLIAEQLGHIKPMSEAFADQFQHMQSWAVDNARPASKDTTVTASPRVRKRSKAAGRRRAIDSSVMDG